MLYTPEASLWATLQQQQQHMTSALWDAPLLLLLLLVHDITAGPDEKRGKAHHHHKNKKHSAVMNNLSEQCKRPDLHPCLKKILWIQWTCCTLERVDFCIWRVSNSWKWDPVGCPYTQDSQHIKPIKHLGHLTEVTGGALHGQHSRSEPVTRGTSEKVKREPGSVWKLFWPDLQATRRQSRAWLKMW